MAAREQPCPYRIVDDFGGAFAMGCVAGCIWNFGKGMYRAPRSGKFIGGLKLLAKRAPILGGNFALWGGLFSLCDCIFTLWRNKQSPWNQVAGGFITGGLLAARAGPRIALRNAIFGGLILGCIQIVEIIITKQAKKRQNEMMISHQQEEIMEARKRYSKVRPDLFSNQGKVLKVKV